ncbi:PEP-CTERM sorting domain-containing protein [Undibacterium sp.]|uniref:PEP-CTERM sorting domain-containing protein n=1 Tax=Undibacterium sp. TaxID=1914977 RepID=UPI0025F959B6|nr:PEP-CTERM sorting domain-containing protein [Undibacterium sp.]
MKNLLASMLLSIVGFATANATVLNATTNVDNTFNLYISTSDASLGTLMGLGNSWPTTYTSSATLAANVTQYIHLVATNQGGPGGFLGMFSLSDNAFAFDNATQVLLTNPTDWKQNTTGFGNATSAAVGEGNNGVGPWGMRPGYGSNSPTWIWNYVSNTGNDFQTVFFSARINAVNNGSQIPEPASLVLLGLGLASLAAARKRGAK